MPTYADLFPSAGAVADRDSPPPFPWCWPEHLHIVLLLALGKQRYGDLVARQSGSYRFEDWIAFNSDYIVPPSRASATSVATGTGTSVSCDPRQRSY